MQSRPKKTDTPFEKIKPLFEACPDGIMLIDRDRRIVAMNPALEKMTGWRAKEVEGRRKCHLLFSCKGETGENTSCRVCSGLKAVNGEGSTSCVELALQGKRGNPILVSNSYGRIDFDGRPYSLVIVREITQRKKEEKELKAQAMTDSLTGLANLRSFLMRLDQEIERSRRYAHPLSLILIDVDHFKQYNDRNGHLQGNRALVRLAQLLTKNSRKSNIVARYGGEEFAVVLPETSKRTAVRAASRLRRAIQEADFSKQQNQPLKTLTISLGVASFPRDADDQPSLIEASDRALYLAKQSGRNRVCWYQRKLKMNKGAGTHCTGGN
jgi:diguanylate cyclase (GGDEF)-like protein/PAS domain S-box-containing protein